jgi:hypothetical protein
MIKFMYPPQGDQYIIDGKRDGTYILYLDYLSGRDYGCVQLKYSCDQYASTVSFTELTWPLDDAADYLKNQKANIISVKLDKEYGIQAIQ